METGHIMCNRQVTLVLLHARTQRLIMAA